MRNIIDVMYEYVQSQLKYGVHEISYDLFETYMLGKGYLTKTIERRLKDACRVHKWEVKGPYGHKILKV